MQLWKLNKATGHWEHQRDVLEETAAQWLAVFQKSEPAETFVIAEKKPPRAFLSPADAAKKQERAHQSAERRWKKRVENIKAGLNAKRFR
jgi:hypothetical protein